MEFATIRLCRSVDALACPAAQNDGERMVLRFRRSVKIAPGVRLNMSKSGPSLSVGGRGTTVNLSKRGTRTTVGIPGTGLSYTSNSRTSKPSSQRRLELEEKQRQRADALARVNVSIDDSGVLTCLDGNGLPLKGRELSMMWEQQGAAIRTLLINAADQINGDIDFFENIHLDAPHPSQTRLLAVEEFPEAEPKRPRSTGKPPEPSLCLPDKPGFFSRLFGGISRYESKVSQLEDEHALAIDSWRARCDVIDADDERSMASWKAEHTEWVERRDAFAHRSEFIEAEHRAKLAEDADYSANTLTEAVSSLEWPRETLISFQLDLSKSTVWLDVDLPEIEDLPDRVATLAASGKRLNVKAKPQKSLRIEYARHIHGIALRIAATVAAVLPWATTISLSGFSQRLDKATGVTSDDYLFSVVFTRAGLEKIDFDSLKFVDPIDAVAAFDHRRKMSSTGVFKVIKPYSPE